MIELAVGYLFSWAARKARHVADRADSEVDRGLDAGMDRLHELVSSKLGADPALESVRSEAAEGREALTESTAQQVRLALEAASTHDPEFAAAVRTEVEALERGAAEESTTGAVAGATKVAGNWIHAEGGSVAVGNVQGSVTLTTHPR